MSNDINIRKLEFYKQEYKSCFFVSNIKYVWKFILDNKQHIIILFFTKLFGKRKIYLDKKMIYNSNKCTNDFNISFPLEFYNITITQRDYFYTLKINNISYHNILNNLKLQKFNILEDDYKEKQRQKRLKQLNRRKNKILQNALNNFNKNENKIQKNLNKIEKLKNGLGTINEDIINTANKLQDESNNEDDSKTIHESFEIHENAFSMFDNIKKINTIKTINTTNNTDNINNINNNENNNKNTQKKRDKKRNLFNKKKKSTPSFNKNIKEKQNDKIQYKTYENVNSSMNEMIYTDLLGDETHNSEERNNNAFRHNISNNNHSFIDKGSLTTQST